MDDIKCYQCNRYGHYARDCREGGRRYFQLFTVSYYQLFLLLFICANFTDFFLISDKQFSINVMVSILLRMFDIDVVT